MHLFFSILFIAIMIKRFIRRGDMYILFSQFVTVTNNLREKSPLVARKKNGTLRLDYQIEGSNRIYCNAIPIEILNNAFSCITDWDSVRALLKNGEDIDVTGKIEHLAGYNKLFHGNVQTPEQLSPKYDILAFHFKDDQVIHVNKGESILHILKKKRMKEKIL